MWRSDAELSLAHMRHYAKLEARTDAFLASLLGHLVHEFSDRELRQSMPTVEVQLPDGADTFEGFEESGAYTFLYCDKVSTVISGRQPATNEVRAIQLHFESAEVFYE